MFLKKRFIPVLLLGLLALGCGKLDNVEGLVDQQETFTSARAVAVTISGIILDPENGEPLIGATVESNSFVAITDSLGFFSVTIDEGIGVEIVTVTQDEHVTFDFPVDYSTVEDGSVLTWDICVPEKQNCVETAPNLAIDASFNFDGVDYNVTIPARSLDEEEEVCVGPSGTVIGIGVPGAFAIAGIDIETEENESITFNNPITIGYDLGATSASNGGIGSVNCGVDSTGVGANITPGAAQAIAAAAEAAQAATGIITTIQNTISGTLLPGIGVVTNTQLIPIDGDGAAISGGAIDLDGAASVGSSIPHQGIGDGN